MNAKWESSNAGKVWQGITEAVKENLFQWYSVHHKAHIDGLGSKLGLGKDRLVNVCDMTQPYDE